MFIGSCFRRRTISTPVASTTSVCPSGTAYRSLVLTSLDHLSTIGSEVSPLIRTEAAHTPRTLTVAEYQPENNTHIPHTDPIVPLLFSAHWLHMRSTNRLQGHITQYGLALFPLRTRKPLEIPCGPSVHDDTIHQIASRSRGVDRSRAV